MEVQKVSSTWSTRPFSHCYNIARLTIAASLAKHQNGSRRSSIYPRRNGRSITFVQISAMALWSPESLSSSYM